MNLIYVCSPFSGNISLNIKKARVYSRQIVEQGDLPLCVHLFLDQVSGLSELNGDRERLLALGIDYLSKCDFIYVFIEDEITSGMKGEIEYAKLLNIPIKYIYVNIMTNNTSF